MKGKAEEKAEGLQEGKQQEKIEMARKLLKQGVSSCAIAQASGFSQEKIMEIMEQND